MWVAEAARLPAETGINELGTPKEKSNGLCQLLKGFGKSSAETGGYIIFIQ